jgi:V/A-type H+-transporting ATPase subunit I
MIVRMKKIAVIMQAKDADSAVKELRRLGVLHVEHQHPPKGKDMNLLQEDLSLVDQALEVISKEEFAEKLEIKEEKNLPADWRHSARHIVDLWKRLDRMQEYFKALMQQINQWRIWGDFNPQEIQSLAEKNIYLRLYMIPQKELAKVPKGLAVETISVKEGVVYCAVISKEKIDFGFKEIELPRLSLRAMQERLLEDEKFTQDINAELKKHLYYHHGLFKVKKSLEKEIEFQQAVNGMAQAETLSYLAGYVPKEFEKELINLANKEKWGIFISDPSEDDNVPTLISNPRWISIVSPIFKFLEIFPGYREWDISPVFIIFFSLFFGMLIGDAGYGLIYMLLTFLAQKKIGGKIKDKSVFRLFYLLSSCAVIWGMSTGTFFGQEWFLKIGYKPLIPALNNPNRIQAFCFFVGALHLTIAHIWRAIIKLPSISSLSDAGWICVVWSVFLLAKTLILGERFPSFGGWLIAAGIGLVVLFNNPQKNILKILNADLITLALGLISSFGEVVSYIRLFAVGMAGVAIADGFNAMAAHIGVKSIAAVIASIFVVMLGHLLCLVLGPLSVLVHGIRLNLLEFSGHANISWSGLAYKPLKE